MSMPRWQLLNAALARTAHQRNVPGWTEEHAALPAMAPVSVSADAPFPAHSLCREYTFSGERPLELGSGHLAVGFADVRYASPVPK